MRKFTKTAALFLLAALLTVTLAPAVFADELELDTPDEYYSRFRGKGVSINVYNWGEYISDGSDDMLNVNAEFEKLTGIRVYYSTFASNEELYSKLRGGASNYDIIIPSEYMISRMLREDMLEPLDFDNIPAFENIDETFLNPSCDPGGEFSVPYLWGITGIIYNKEMVFEDVTSWDILWDEKYAGQILMFSNPRDTFAIAQKRLGYSMNTTDVKELENSLNELKKQKMLVQAYVMDEIFDKMLGGEAALAPYYAGDAVTMMDQNPDLDFAIPEEGVNFFFDALCIPKGSKQKTAAEMYINFLCEPEISAANAEFTGYATPNAGALELLDEEIVENPIAYPPPEVLENAEEFIEPPHEIGLVITKLWTELLSSDENYSKLLVPVLLLTAVLLSVAINVYRMVNKNKKQKFYF